MNRALLAPFAVAVFLALLAGPTSAEVTGPCRANVNGVELETHNSDDVGDAIPLDEDGTYPFTFETQGTGIKTYRAKLSYGPIQQVIADKSPDDAPVTQTADITLANYAWLGAGLYKLHGEAILVDGSECKVTALIDVQGNPLTTLAGLLGAGFAVVGVLGVGAGALSALNSTEAVRKAVETWRGGPVN